MGLSSPFLAWYHSGFFQDHVVNIKERRGPAQKSVWCERWAPEGIDAADKRDYNQVALGCN